MFKTEKSSHVIQELWLTSRCKFTVRISESCGIVFGNEIRGFSVNARLCNPMCSVFITRKHPSPIPTTFPVLIVPILTRETCLQYVVNWVSRWFLPSHSLFPSHHHFQLSTLSTLSTQHNVLGLSDLVIEAGVCICRVGKSNHMPYCLLSYAMMMKRRIRIPWNHW